MIFVGSNTDEKCAAQLATIAQNCWPTSLNIFINGFSSALVENTVQELKGNYYLHCL